MEGFKVEDTTLVEYMGEKRSYSLYKKGRLVSRFDIWDKSETKRLSVPGSIKQIDYGAISCENLQELVLSEGVEEVRYNAIDAKKLKRIWLPHSLRVFYHDTISAESEVHIHYAPGVFPALQKAGFVWDKLPAEIKDRHSGLILALRLAKLRLINLHLHVVGDVEDHEFNGLFECNVHFSHDIRAKYLFQKSMVKNVVIQKAVYSIDPDAFLGGEPFFEDVEIESFTAEGHFFCRDGVLFDARLMTLLRYPPAKQKASYQVPSWVQSIASGAFDGCYLEKLIIPKSVKLEEGSLANMRELEEVVYVEGEG